MFRCWRWCHQPPQVCGPHRHIGLMSGLARRAGLGHTRIAGMNSCRFARLERVESKPAAMRRNEIAMATAVADLAGLLQDIPAGAWVAISERENKVVAYGVDAQAVLSEAQAKGEEQPLIVRVPEQARSLFL